MKQSVTFWLLLSCVSEGLFPVVSHLIAPDVPYFFFLTFTSFTSALLFAIVITAQGYWVLPQKNILRLIACNALITAMYYLSIFVGTQYTSGINTALLTRTEIFTTFLFAYFVLKERLNCMQMLGALVLLSGVIAILYNGTLQLNRGDLLLISMTLFLPYANHCAKKALAALKPVQVLFYRFLFTGFMLLPCTLLANDLVQIGSEMHSVIMWAVLYGVSYFGIIKLIWYNGLRGSDLGRAIYIISGYPAFSILFAFLLLGEIPTLFQVVGFILVMIGIFFLSKENSVVQKEIDLV